ncbi:MAG: hypothetical protein AAF658_12110, partial [Myxococcota bacterium]
SESPTEFLPPLHTGLDRSHWNFDGYILGTQTGGGWFEYTQFFHNGTIEIGEPGWFKRMLDLNADGKPPSARRFESALGAMVQSAANSSKKLQVRGPAFWTLFLRGTQSLRLKADADHVVDSRIPSITEDELMFPLEFLEYGEDHMEVGGRLADRLWQAGGYAGSPNWKASTWQPSPWE